MAQSTSDDADKKNEISTSAFIDPDVQGSYDAFDFLYNSVPFGEYPEVTAETAHSNQANPQSQNE